MGSSFTWFLFGDQHWHSVLGWHLSIFIVAVAAWQLSKIYHQRF